MPRTILVESSDLTPHEQIIEDENLSILDEQEIIELSVLSSNEIAKMEMAAELINQGLSEDSVCRMLSISHELLPARLLLI